MKTVFCGLILCFLCLKGSSQPNTYSITKNFNYLAGTNDFVNFGSISNVGDGTFAKFRINGHSCSFLFISEFEFMATFYANSTEWLKLPITNSNDYNGTQQLSFEVRTTGHGQPYELRLRRLMASGCSGIVAPISISIQTNGIYSDLPASIQGTETATVKYYGNTAGWQFPVSTLTFAPTENGLFIKPNGNIGVGTSNPQELLSVKGTVLAKKVKVSTTPGDWPDYVFHPTYKLRSLSSLEDYIKQNSHLPDVPSEKEVQTGGIDLGATQTILLKKIEELTLYVIDLSNDNKKQQQQIEKLKAANASNRR